MPPIRPWHAAVAVGVIAVAAQAPAIGGVLVWDDVLLLGRSDLYTSPARWIESVTTTLGRETFYWRPVATSSFLVESLVHGGAAWGFRLTAALLHAGASVLAFTLLLRLAGRPLPALLAALAFAVHPVNVEAVTWASARFDLCAGLFSLAALAAIPRDDAPRSGARWIAPAGLALLAACSKENAVILPLLALLWTAALGGPPGRSRWAPAGWIAVGVAAALFLRFEAIGFLFRTREASVAEAGGPAQHLLLVGRAVATSLETLVWPWGTVGPAHHALRPIPRDDALGWTGVGLGGALVVLTIVLLVRRRRVGMLLAAFLLSLAPASQIVPLDLAGGLHSADRFLYLPLFFAVAAAAETVRAAAESRPVVARAAGVASAILVAGLLAGRLVVLPRWNDPVRFWSWAADMAPGADVVQSNLARAHLDADPPRLDAAERHARLAGPLGVHLLVEALWRQPGREPDAVRTLDAAIHERPDDAESLVQRGEILLEGMGTAEDAARDFEAAIAVERSRGAQSEPILPRALAGGAHALAAIPGRDVSARDLAEAAERVAAPGDAATWLRLTRAWSVLKQPDRARSSLDRAAAAGASSADIEALRREIR